MKGTTSTGTRLTATCLSFIIVERNSENAPAEL